MCNSTPVLWQPKKCADRENWNERVLFVLYQSAAVRALCNIRAQPSFPHAVMNYLLTRVDLTACSTYSLVVRMYKMRFRKDTFLRPKRGTFEVNTSFFSDIFTYLFLLLFCTVLKNISLI